MFLLTFIVPKAAPMVIIDQLRIFTKVIYCRFGSLIIKLRPFARLGNDLKTFWLFCFLQCQIQVPPGKRYTNEHTLRGCACR
jgi:hypothetical protein